MKDEQIKKIIEKSKLETSDGFTDRLMDKIEASKSVETAKPWGFRTVLFAILAIIVTISFCVFKLSGGSLGMNYGFESIGFIVLLVFIFLGSFALNELLSLKSLSFQSH